jgi:hypothetical protein
MQGEGLLLVTVCDTPVHAAVADCRCADELAICCMFGGCYVAQLF